MPHRPEVPAVLARHGVDPDAGEAALVAALAARGWTAQAEESADGHLPRFRAVAFRARATVRRSPRSMDYRRGRGRTAAAALGWVLALVLEYEEAGETGPARAP